MVGNLDLQVFRYVKVNLVLRLRTSTAVRPYTEIPISVRAVVRKEQHLA